LGRREGGGLGLGVLVIGASMSGSLACATSLFDELISNRLYTECNSYVPINGVLQIVLLQEESLLCMWLLEAHTY